MDYPIQILPGAIVGPLNKGTPPVLEEATPPSFLVIWITTIVAMVSSMVWKVLGLGDDHPVCWWFDGLSKTCRTVRKYRTTSLALEYLYLERNDDATAIGRSIIKYWHRLRNVQAVKNRLQITIHELQNAITHSGKNRIVIFSIASGSAEAVLQACVWAADRGITIQVYLLDRDPAALARARTRAAQLGVEHCLVRCFEADVRQLERVATEIPVLDIIEMVGFLDYRPPDKATSLIRRLRALLPRGGQLITAQICPNPEKWFVHHVLGWWMIYRTPEQFERLFWEAGFRRHEVALTVEPWRIHCVAVAQRG